MSTEDFINSDDDYGDVFIKRTYDRPFLEKLLLAIINAHPVGEELTQTRLNKAMMALVGEKSSKLPLAGDMDLEALTEMGLEFYRDKVRRTDHMWKHRKNRNPPPPPKIRSARALAEFAVKKCFSSRLSEQEVEVAVDRLREKFNGTYGSKPKNVNARDYYIHLAVERDDLVESIEHQALEEICEKLREQGIKTKLRM